MTNSLLRSGCPDDFLSLGENGQAVFDSALQIRETLRLRKQQAVADALAIPQINDSGSRVDWYAPNPGKVTSWAAATEEQRKSALRYLEHCLSSVNLLSTQCQRSEKTTLRLFGSLLAKALQFPGSQYIYLVADKPVITFWGFVNQNETAREDLFACLQIREPRETFIAPPPRPVEPAPMKEQPSEPVAVTAVAAVAAVAAVPPVAPRSAEIAAAYAVEAETPSEPVITPVAEVASVKPRRWVASAAAFVVLIALVGAWYVYVQPAETTAEIITETDVVAPVAPVVVQPVELPASTLPLMLAAVLPPVVEVPEPVVPVAPVVKGALVLPADALKNGSTKFLNGTWQVRVPATGKATTMRYRILNNKGSVRFTSGSNVTCKADVYSGIHQSGTVMIKSRSSARCENGTRQPLPEISCKSGANGVAECTGRYEGDNLVAVTFQKVSN